MKRRVATNIDVTEIRLNSLVWPGVSKKLYKVNQMQLEFNNVDQKHVNTFSILHNLIQILSPHLLESGKH